MPPQNEHGLVLTNATKARARIRFYCHKRLVWDACLGCDGGLQIPDPASAPVCTSARFTDPRIGVTYTTSMRTLAGACRIGARYLTDGSAVEFSLFQGERQETADVVLENHTRSNVQFAVTFEGTPFCFETHIGAGMRETLRLGDMSLVVVIDGLTSKPWPLSSWGQTLGISLADVRGERFPCIHQMDGRGHGSW